MRTDFTDAAGVTMGGMYWITVVLAVIAIQMTEQRFLGNITMTTAVPGESYALQPRINGIEGDEKAEGYAANHQHPGSISHRQLRSEEHVSSPYILPPTEAPILDESVNDVRNETAYQDDGIIYYAINIVLLEMIGVVWAVIIVLGIYKAIRNSLENGRRCPNIADL